jgi:tetratricopeptide (TPR) repeat protein
MTNSTTSGNETQLKTFFQKKHTPIEKKTFVEKRLARSSSKKETEEKTAEKNDSEEKPVEKKEGFSLFQGEKKLENLLLKAEEETAKGNYQLAKFFYEKYLEEKKDPRVYNNYGGVLFLLGDYEGAEKAFVMALSLEQNPVFKLNLILTKIKLNQTKEACQMFRQFQKELEQLKEVVFIKNICGV